jgi:hypothetical protein
MVYLGEWEPDMTHVAYCFDYLKQAILCAGDTTLEGSSEYGDGWGSMHQCQDMDEIRSWAEDRSTLSWLNFGDIL